MCLSLGVPDENQPFDERATLARTVSQSDTGPEGVSGAAANNPGPPNPGAVIEARQGFLCLSFGLQIERLPVRRARNARGTPARSDAAANKPNFPPPPRQPASDRSLYRSIGLSAMIRHSTIARREPSRMPGVPRSADLLDWLEAPSQEVWRVERAACVSWPEACGSADCLAQAGVSGKPAYTCRVFVQIGYAARRGPG